MSLTRPRGYGECKVSNNYVIILKDYKKNFNTAKKYNLRKKSSTKFNIIKIILEPTFRVTSIISHSTT